MTCPRCGAEAAGNFCASCGASLKPGPCPSCGTQPDAGDRFCNRCGTFLQGEADVSGGAGAPATRGAGGSPNIGWAAAGGLLVVLILVLAWPRLQASDPPQRAGAVAPAGGAAAPGAASGVDLSSMTPREAADRLFNRVMQAVSAGNDAEVQSFLPMAVAAHERAMPLDADGMFHLALLQLTAQDLAGAVATAESALADEPDHLLLLSVAAEAQKEAGNDEAAAELYRHILDVWETETTAGREEYDAHRETIREIEADARDYLTGR